MDNDFLKELNTKVDNPVQEKQNKTPLPNIEDLSIKKFVEFLEAIVLYAVERNAYTTDYSSRKKKLEGEILYTYSSDHEYYTRSRVTINIPKGNILFEFSGENGIKEIAKKINYQTPVHYGGESFEFCKYEWKAINEWISILSPHFDRVLVRDASLFGILRPSPEYKYEYNPQKTNRIIEKFNRFANGNIKITRTGNIKCFHSYNDSSEEITYYFEVKW